MRGILATLRLDLRMLRREYLGAVALLALSLFGAAFAEAHAVGGGARGLLFGALLAAVGGAAAMRIQRVDAGWAAFLPTLPVPHGMSLVLQLLTRFGFTLLLGVAFARWTEPHGDLDWSRAYTAALWLLLLMQVVGWGTRARRHAGSSSFGRSVMLGVSAVLLGLTLLDLAASGDPIGPSARTTRSFLVLWILVCWTDRLVASIQPLPHSGPKAVLPRVRPAAGALRRGITPRSPAQVLRHLGLGGARQWAGLLPCFVAGFAVGSHDAFAEWRLWWAPLPVLGTGIGALKGLRELGRSIGFMRSYPLQVGTLWRRALLPAIVVFLLGLALRAQMVHGFRHAPPTSDVEVVGTRVTERLRGSSDVRVEFYPFERAVLRVPGWAQDWTFPAEHRVGDPMPRGPVWWLRDEEDWRGDWRRVERGHHAFRVWAEWEPVSEPEPPERVWALRVPLEQEREHFARVLQTWLARVHGVQAGTEECASLLDVSDTIRRKRTVLRNQVFGELWSARGTHVFDREDRVLGTLFRRVDVVDALIADRLDEEGAVIPPIPLHSYTTGTGRIDRVFGARIMHAARLVYALDVAIQLLALLLFLRFAMTRKTMMALTPLLPVVALYGWFGTRGQDWHLAVRDAHLAHPWASLLLGLLVFGILLRSIARNLDALGS